MVRVSTKLLAPAAVVFDTVKKSSTLRHVTRGLMGMTGSRRFPEEWRAGDVVRPRLFFFHWIPGWRQEIRIAQVDPARRLIESTEKGGILRRWDHRITVEPLGESECLYTDEIDVEAGLLTPLVRFAAGLFYRYRQRRWRKLVEGGLAHYPNLV